MLQRTYGGAVYSHRSRFNVSFLEKLQIEAPAKDAIAQLALNYIHEGDTIILDAGSTTLALARALQGKLRSLYVITNSIPAALELSRAGYEILLIGGQVRSHSLALIGRKSTRIRNEKQAPSAATISCRLVPISERQMCSVPPPDCAVSAARCFYSAFRPLCPSILTA